MRILFTNLHKKPEYSDTENIVTDSILNGMYIYLYIILMHTFYVIHLRIF